MKVIKNILDFQVCREKSEKPLVAYVSTGCSGEILYYPNVNRILNMLSELKIKVLGCYINKIDFLNKLSTCDVPVCVGKGIKLLTRSELENLQGNFEIVIVDEALLFYAGTSIRQRLLNQFRGRDTLEKKVKYLNTHAGEEYDYLEFDGWKISGNIYYLERLNINEALKYSRMNKLQNREFTIISNDCIAGSIYSWLNMPMYTPTLNCGIETDDFVKLCNDLEHYVNCTLDYVGMEYLEITNDIYPVGKLDDIYIKFKHFDTWDKAARMWSRGCKNIKWEHLFFVLDERLYNVSKENIEEFIAGKQGKRLVFSRKYSDIKNNIIYRDDAYDFCSNHLIPFEEYFDIVKWINE